MLLAGNENGGTLTDVLLTYHIKSIGQYLLVYFGFTFCPDICPHELVKMGKAINKLDSMDLPMKVTPIFISVDPKRDTVSQLKEYGKGKKEPLQSVRSDYMRSWRDSFT